ncbi:ABC-type antibiotic transporter permease protein [Candidatus Symbiobacter mobilis CR]|uniref:Transport permease protein n=2 Tax=Candidatus Symbiobacter TaxID=1436289 RepID=U5N5A4_9BURK|nr:ABC-type antibiotic transporter permease protein [Candidatus Symbiobacter mobilis CR]
MLLYKEVLRFWRVAGQTIAGPVLTAMLYLLIFGNVLDEHVRVYDAVRYTAFLVPGLAMMSLLQNAFANSASSLIMAKVMGNVVFLLLSPLTYVHWFLAFVGASVLRGLLVGAGVFLAAGLFVPVGLAHPLWVLAFALLGAVLMGSLGIVAGLWAEKFDQMAAFQNFVVMPMTFLSGVFYSTHSLPPLWQTVSRCNPFFYMIDGFRYGVFGVSDVGVWHSLAVVGSSTLLVAALALQLLRSGYRLRS